MQERLYSLLPAIYRQRDFFLGEPLRALLAIVEGELEILEADIHDLYENWFVETCDEWVLPYIAELVGIRDLNDAEKIFPVQRRRIGNAIRYRRHKGTPRTLELAIEDTTGWTVRVVEMFKYVLTTQHIQRVRPEVSATFRLTQSREMVVMRDYARTLDIGAFDRSNRVRYDLKSMSLFIWRLQSYSVKGSTPCYRQELPIKTVNLRPWQKEDDDSRYEFERAVFGFNTLPSQRQHTLQVSPRRISNQNNFYQKAIDKQSEINQTGCYTFHPLGYDMPLFNRPKARENMWAHNLDSRELPMAISHDAFEEDLRLFQSQPPENQIDEKFIKTFSLSDGEDWAYPKDIVEAGAMINTTYSLSEGENVYRKSVDLKEILAKPEIQWNSQYYYGPERSLAIYIRRGKNQDQSGEFGRVQLAKIVAKKLTNWEPPPAGKIAIDVELGRLMFARGEDPGWDNIQVDFSYGFSGNMGGGPYNRGPSMSVETENIWWVGKNQSSNKGKCYDTLTEAIGAWQKSGESHGTIRIMGNKAQFNARTQSGMPIVGQTLAIELKPCDRLTIEAGNGYNPSICPLGGDIIVIAGQEEEATLRLHGLLCGGKIAVVGNVKLEVDHCTVRPQQINGTQPSIVGATARCYDLEVGISHSIVGPVNLPGESRELVVSDSIIDGAGWAAISSEEEIFGPLTKIARSTILGRVYTREMELGSETIFVEPVMVERKERGGMRFCYAPLGEKIPEGNAGEKIYYYQTPERYKCQPEPENWERGPSFTARQYGQPGYGQLNFSCPEEIQKGAEKREEMGAFNNLKRPQRELDLKASLEEYLRLGLEVNKIYKN